MSGGQQNKDEEVVKMVARMTELKEKQESASLCSFLWPLQCFFFFSSVSVFVFYWCEKRQARSVFYLFFAVFLDALAASLGKLIFRPGSRKHQEGEGWAVRSLGIQRQPSKKVWMDP